MIRKRRVFTRDFKINIIREVEQGIKQAEICRKYDVHPVMLNRWMKEFRKYPDSAFNGKGHQYKDEARIAELERLVGKLYAENDFLKKALNALEKHAEMKKEQEKSR
jgi:transposase